MSSFCLLLIALFFAFTYGQWETCRPHVEKVVRPGDNVTLHCDCKLDNTDIQWVKSCTPLFQSMTISTHKSLIEPVPRFSVVWNDVNKSTDLIIENITESDLGIYYCATVHYDIRCGPDGKMAPHNLYQFCNTSTRLSYEVNVVAEKCDCSQWCWLLLKAVCPACAVVSALLSSVCVFCCCRKSESTSNQRRATITEEQSEDTQVYYASLKIPKGTSRRVNRKASLNPDFSTYSEVIKGQG